MSNAEEIEKLGQLHKQGLITDEEFTASKKALLRTPSKGKARKWHSWWGLTIPLFLVGFGSLFHLNFSGRDSDAIPLCNEPVTLDYVKKTIADSPIGKVEGISIISLKDIRELKYSESPEKRECSAIAMLNSGEDTRIHYELWWEDNNKKGNVLIKVQFR